MRKYWFSNGEVDIQLSEEDVVPEGFFRGRKCLSSKMIGKFLSEETKSKISSSSKGRTPHNKGKKETSKHVYYTNGEVSIRIEEGSAVPDGFHKGRLKRKLTDEEKVHFNISRKETNKSKHGDCNYNNHEKFVDTCITTYGVDNPMKDTVVLEKIKDSSYTKYGVANVFSAGVIKDKIKNTKEEKYGYSNSFKNPETLSKAIVNSHTDTANEKRKSTCMAHFGVPYSGCLFGAPTSKDSKPNLEFKSLLLENGLFESDEVNREVTVGSYRYDFCIGDTLIEINPHATHNSTFSPYRNGKVRDKNYHHDKLMNAIEHGHSCISIWDWDDAYKIINLLSNERLHIVARKCTIREISDSDAKDYLDTFHLQGYVKGAICNIALEHNEKIVSLMTFGKPRYNKDCEYELLRYCSSANVTGGAEKIFKYFINTYNPTSVVSYCDLSKFNGNVYTKLGFSLLRTSIGKHWYNPKLKAHITDNLLRQRGFDQLFGDKFGYFGKGTNNNELMIEHGFVEIYDCGQATYVWKSTNKD